MPNKTESADTMDYLQTILQDHINNILKKQDDLIRSKLIENGFDPNNTEFLKKHFEIRRFEGNPYDHYFMNVNGKETRIISISEMDFNEKDGMFSAIGNYY